MIRFITISLFNILLISCAQNHSSFIKKPIIVDYKSDIYAISIGENYKKSDKIINWRWDAEGDPDRKIDSTGIDTFLYLGEPLIKYNGSEYLPALFIKTDRNIIKSFKCSMLFDLKNDENASNEFLTLISQKIKKLKSDSIKELLTQKGKIEIIKRNITETYKLTKHKGMTNHSFEYKVSLNKNAR